MKTSKMIALTGVTLATLVISSASMADNSWGKYKWKPSSIPFNLDLGNNVDDIGWYNFLSSASYEWSKSVVLDTPIVDGSTDKESCSPQAGNVQVCNYAYGFNGWLGLAQIYTRGNTIIAGLAKVNDTYFDTAPYDSDQWREMVMCQEIAHTFGLDHQDETFGNVNLGTCMDYTNDPDGSSGQWSNLHPNGHDYDQLESMYPPPIDDDDGGGGGGRGGGGGGCNPNSPKCNSASAAGGHAQWGQLVSGHGGIEIYERRLRGSLKVITFVTWTLEHADSHEH